MKPNSKTNLATHRVTRRQLIKGVSAGVFVATAPWVTSVARAAGELTVILNQGLLAKLWIDELNPKFEKATGAKLNIQQSVTGNMLAMLRTQKDNPPDLMQFSEAGVFLARDTGLLRQINASAIPNWKYMKKAFNMADDYSAGMIDAMNTIFYNTNEQKTAPTAWADLWDPANKGRIAIPPIAWNNGVRMVVTAAQVATGKPLAEAQYEIEAGIAQLAKLKQNDVRVYSGAPQALQLLQSGEIPLVPFYLAFAAPVMAQGAPIYPATYLKEGKQGEIVGLNMPVNAKNVELAQEYINMSLEKDFQEKIENTLRARCAHIDVTPSPETEKLLGPADNTTYADWAFLSKNRPKITEMWNEVFS
ncbi:MAG: extracellular solute-binding protein [Burkholderiaceae bacterium]|nr:extracellular solute-binding protein [Burkholderiaceae bacterium]MCD8538055.1 extracellular solute-binding protein [Burkholderiaceae bacterium]MCD8565412.1 extracellular solute-binding protein [Burkholderiaceae bacterium]